MKVFAFACIIFAVFTLTSLQRTPFYPCYDKLERILPEALLVDVEECDDLPCEIKENSKMHSHVDFVVQNNTEWLKRDVNIIVGSNISEYMWGTDYDACKSLVIGGCPLKSGQFASYNRTMYLEEVPKHTPFWFEIKFVNEDDIVQVCFRLYSKFIQ